MPLVDKSIFHDDWLLKDAPDEDDEAPESDETDDETEEE